MTTPNEREARELLAREYERGNADQERSFADYIRGGGNDRGVRVALRAIIAALTREQREGDALADTQRAIIEAAEQRGYERGKAEWRQQVKDAWDNLSVEKVEKPKDTGRFA